MTGGIVIDTEELKNKIRIDIVTDQYKEKHSVFVERTAAARCIQPDDSAFWNGNYVFWSPKFRYFHDYPLKQIGQSFVTEKKAEYLVAK
jgi:hypothetical protein